MEIPKHQCLTATGWSLMMGTTAVLCSAGAVSVLAQSVMPLEVYPPPPMRRGIKVAIFDMQPSFNTGLSYSDNESINIGGSGGRNRGDYIGTVGASFLFTTRNSEIPGAEFLRAQASPLDAIEPGARLLAFQYSPGYSYYLSNRGRSSPTHNFNLRGSIAFSRLSLNLGQTYGLSFSQVQEVGSQRLMETYSTTFGAQYEYSPKTVFGAGINYNTSSYGQSTGAAQLNNTDSYGLSTTADYRITPKTSMGVGTSTSMSSGQMGGKAISQTLQGRLNYLVTDKLSANSSGGLNLRQFAGAGNQWSPGFIFSMGLGYRLNDRTSLSLSGNRSTDLSPLQGNQDRTTTSFGGGLTRQLSERLSLSGSTSYGTSTYSGIGTTGGNSGSMDTLGFGLDLSARLTDHWAGSLNYSRSQNTSTSINNYARNQIGVRFTWNY